MSRIYQSHNISEEQQRFIRLLDDFETQIFNLAEIESLINEKFPNINSILENLASKSFLTRIERGKYCRSNFRNENVIGCFLAKDGAVAYWSALNSHGLQPDSPIVFLFRRPIISRKRMYWGLPIISSRYLSAK